MRHLIYAVLMLLTMATTASAQLFADRVREITTTTGTGTLNLGGAVASYRTFVAGIGTGNESYYCIVHRTVVEWECGLGTVTDASPDTLSRDTVLSSSTGSALSFSAGTKDVFSTVPAAFYTAAVVAGSALTANNIPKAVDAKTVTNSCLSDNGTTVTVDPACTGGIVAPSFTGSGTGIAVYGGAEGTVPSAAASGHWLLAMDGTAHTVQLSQHGGGFLPIVVNPVPSGTAVAGSLLTTAITAPGTPAAGKASVYIDSTSKNLAVKDDAGVVKHGGQSITCTSGDFFSAFSDAGVYTCGTPSGGGGGGVAVNIQTFSADGTWTKPASVLACRVLACGSGGGGGGGQGAAVSTIRSGGGGGGGGICRSAVFRAADLSATEAVTAPAGGSGGSGGSTAAGGDGNSGGTALFGTKMQAFGGGGGGGHTAGAAGGSGAGCTGAGVAATNATGTTGGACFVVGLVTGTTSTDSNLGASGPAPLTPGAAGNGSSGGGASGAASSANGTVSVLAGGSSLISGGGGGAGGGVNAANPGTAQAGTDGGQSGGAVSASSGGGGAGGAAGAGGTAGAAGNGASGGSGGGGGGSSASTTGSAGAAGGIGGGGGGGGGAGTSVGGAGGAGGAAWVVVTCW